MKALVYLVLPLALNACSLVVSERAVGDKPVDATGFAGTWTDVGGDGDILDLAVKHAKRGIITLHDGEDLLEFELREKHGWVFANRVVAEDGATGFVWYRVEMAPDRDRFRLWTPDAEVFKGLILAGTLKGRIVDRGQPPPAPGAAPNPPAQNPGASGTVVAITEKDDRWIQNMMEGRYGAVFDNDSPVTYVRVPRGDPGDDAE